MIMQSFEALKNLYENGPDLIFFHVLFLVLVLLHNF